MKWKIASLLFLFFVLGKRVIAQLNNDPFFKYFPQDSIENKQWALSLDHLNFLKNNEYFNKIQDGRTLFGFHLMPRLQYQAHSRLRLEGGVFAWKDYGNTGFQQVEPIFTARYTAGPNQVLMGTLDGGLEHCLIEPLYDFENQMLRRLEYGFQWKHNSQKLKLDAWVDWRNMIYPNSPVQEQIVGGLLAEPVLFERKRSRISLSFQGTAYHKGGQIDTSNMPLTNWFNGATGLKIITIPGHGIILKYLEFQGYALGFKDQSNEKTLPKNAGFGTYLNLKASTLWFDIMLSHWQGNDFASFQGGPLFRSFSTSVKNPEFYQSQRQLLFIRLFRDWEIAPNIWISARLEPYFDLKNNTWEFSHGLYFNYRGLLWKSKNG
jgi:hypothetical protein